MAVNTNANQTLPVLVVDDFPAMRKILRQQLTELGFSNIVEAEDGEAALGKLHSTEFQLVISDWSMPKMSGIELLRGIRSDPKLSQLCFVMVTAEAQKKNIKEATKAGVNGFVCKPFTAEILKQRIEEALEHQV